MRADLSGKLEEGEKLLWVRMPSALRGHAGLLVTQIIGHVLLTGLSVFFAFLFPVSLALRIVLSIILIVVTNGPLVAWAFYRWPQIRGAGDAVFFVTDRRVGMVRETGEMRQAPICPGLRMTLRAGVIEFRLGEATPVSFGGLRRDEQLLVTVIVGGLVKKDGGESPSDPPVETKAD